MSEGPTTALNVRRVDVAKIEVGEGFNPRTEFEANQLKQLSRSIDQRGMLQPIVVRPNGTGYTLVDGERRFRAILDLGWSEVDVTIRETEGDAEALVDAVAANQIRVGLNPIEEALAYDRLRESGKNARQIASELSVGEKVVKDRLALLTLPEGVRKHIAAGDIPLGVQNVLLTAAGFGAKIAEDVAQVAVEFARTSQQVQDAPLWKLEHEDPERGYAIAYVFDTPPEWFLPSADLQEIVNECKALDQYSHPTRLDRAVFSEGKKVGVIWDPQGALEEDAYGRRQPVLVADLPWLADAQVRSAKKELQKLRRMARERAKSQEERGIVPKGHVVEDGKVRELSDEEKAERRKDERESQKRIRDAAFGANHNAGADIYSKTQAKDLDRDVILGLVRIAIGNEVASLGAAGMAFCLPQYTEEPAKAHLPRRYNGEQAAHDCWEFIAAGETPEAIVARFAQVIAFASVANHDAVAESNRPQRPARAGGVTGEWARWYCAEGLPKKVAIAKVPPIENPVAAPPPPEKDEEKKDEPATA